jgi:photosystem II stability/assembly factor-like uncharacterized protein
MQKHTIILKSLLLFILFPLSAQSQWVKSTGISSLVMEFSQNESSVYAGLLFNGILVSTDQGVSWVKRNNGLSDSVVYSVVSKDSNVFVGTANGVYQSANKGLSWKKINDLPNILFVSLAMRENLIFAASQKGLYRSTDSGISWDLMNTELLNLGDNKSIFIDDSLVFLGTEYGLYRSANNGLNWSVSNTGLANNSGVFSYVQSDSFLFVGTYNGVYRSSNYGINWLEINNGISATNVEGMIQYGNNIFAAISGNGVYLSTNNGRNWAAVNTGLDDKVILSLSISGPNLIAGGVQGIWLRPLNQMITSVNNSENNAITEFQLLQNYPNPFNPTTSIIYQLPMNEFVTIKIFDVLGREVTTLLKEHKSAGSYNTIFNANNISSGTYYYRLQAGNYSATKKMQIVK